jgi:polyisoprenoid-binding protein YceI
MRTLFATILAGLFMSLPAMAKPVTYKLDPNHTQVRVVWNHFGFSNPSANFTHVNGTLVYDAEHPTQSSVRVNIPLSGLDTHVDALDEHLKGADFFDIAKYPEAHFVSTGVREAGKGRLTVTGKLSVHGVTRPVTLHVKINKIGMQPMRKVPAAGFDATATLKRSDFGVGAYAPMVSDAVRLHITVEADATGH